SIGPVEIVVKIDNAGDHSPRLPKLVGPPAPEPVEDSARKQELDARTEELDDRQKKLDEQVQELEVDRVIWYRRREEMEQEFRQRADSGNARSPVKSKGGIDKP